MDYLTTFTGKGGRFLRGTASRLWGAVPGSLRQVRFQDSQSCGAPGPAEPAPDTGQKKTPDKKDGRRMSFQKPRGTIEYSVESRDTLNSIALKFDTTPNELVQLNKLFSRAVVPGQILYVPDPDYISSVDSSPSLSPISPLSPTSSEAELDKATVNDPDGVQQKESAASPVHACVRPTRVVSSTSEEEEAFTEKFLKINCKYITNGKFSACCMASLAFYKGHQPSQCWEQISGNENDYNCVSCWLICHPKLKTIPPIHNVCNHCEHFISELDIYSIADKLQQHKKQLLGFMHKSLECLCKIPTIQDL